MSTWRWLGASAAALWLVPQIRYAVEAGMATHMLLQFPLLMASGACACGLLPTRLRAAWERVDAMGITSAILASSVGIYWMIPAALDSALLSPWVDVSKHLSWWLSGLALASAWARLGGVLRLFFFGNAGWMLASVGMLYHDAEARLCVNYRFDEQRATGIGLLIAAGLMGIVALASWRQPSRGSSDGRPTATR